MEKGSLALRNHGPPAFHGLVRMRVCEGGGGGKLCHRVFAGSYFGLSVGALHMEALAIGISLVSSFTKVLPNPCLFFIRPKLALPVLPDALWLNRASERGEELGLVRVYFWRSRVPNYHFSC